MQYQPYDLTAETDLRMVCPSRRCPSPVAAAWGFEARTRQRRWPVPAGGSFSWSYSLAEHGEKLALAHACLPRFSPTDDLCISPSPPRKVLRGPRVLGSRVPAERLRGYAFLDYGGDKGSHIVTHGPDRSAAKCFCNRRRLAWGDRLGTNALLVRSSSPFFEALLTAKGQCPVDDPFHPPVRRGTVTLGVC